LQQDIGLSDIALEALILSIARERSREAFVALFEACASKLKAFAMRGGASEALAEDLLQECMLTVWHKAHTYRPDAAAATTWLYTIMRNKRIDTARKSQFEEVVSDDLWPEESGELLENQVASDLEAKAVRIMLQSLPEEQRQIVYKVYFEGKSHSEIADELDLPLGTIKSRLRLAMNKLDTLAKEHVTWLIIILLTNY
jgi:RNA polymerase sigma-70 factor (ECF subfamily)